MNSEDQIRKIFLIGVSFLLVIIVGGLGWAIFAENDDGQNIDPNITFNDNRNPETGPSDAKVTVRIYSDFQCPACKIAESELAIIRTEYQDRVRFIWNDFPLTNIHPNAPVAALAARCAGEQGRFWEYAEKIYESQEEWEYSTSPRNHFFELVNELNLNEEKFNQCLFDENIMDLIEKDFQEAIAMNLNSTPTFFINRKMITGAMDQASWRQELDSALAK
ncbi:thioredoxin domain-containing protein [Candidatus Uhrbacteria bacterium]|nr:thioredoxin domain-containing protein [Candidatus Uhrbacteria bacterium]